MMTMTSEEALPGVGIITVRDEMGPVEFLGEVLADLTWSYGAAAEAGHPRWTDLKLIRLHDPQLPYKYVLQTVGRSVVYHNPDGPCHRGVRKTVDMLYQEAERYDALQPCRKPGCQPKDLDKLDVVDVVSVEGDIPSLDWCVDANKVIEVMYSPGQGGGRRRTTGSGDRNGLSLRLLQEVTPVDKDIEAALMRVRMEHLRMGKI